MVVVQLILNLFYAFPKFLPKARICFLIRENVFGKEIQEEEPSAGSPSRRRPDTAAPGGAGPLWGHLGARPG